MFRYNLLLHCIKLVDREPLTVRLQIVFCTYSIIKMSDAFSGPHFPKDNIEMKKVLCLVKIYFRSIIILSSKR